ncbi:hypothetical protein BaRGS_00017757, partial [Batillaria attramentaria]
SLLSESERWCAIEQMVKTEKDEENLFRRICRCPEKTIFEPHTYCRCCWKVKDGIFVHCKAEKLKDLLVPLVAKGFWQTVGEVLGRGVSERDEWFAVEQAVKRAPTKPLLPILPYCPEEKFRLVLQGLVQRGLWEAVGTLLFGNLTETDSLWAVEEACKTADERPLIDFILRHCPAEDFHQVFSILTRRRLWTAVKCLLHRAVAGDDTQFMWVVEEAFQHAPGVELKSIVQTYCPYACVEGGVRTCMRRGLWCTVSVLLKRGVSDCLRREAVEEACRMATFNSQAETDMFSNCTDDEIRNVFPTLVKHGRWVAVSLLLERDIMDFAQQLEVVKMAVKSSRAWDYDRDFGLRNTLFGFRDRTDQRDRFLSEMLDKGYWKLFVQMLKVSDERWAKEVSATKPNSRFDVQKVGSNGNLLHVLCASGLWRSMPHLVKLGVNPLAVDKRGCSLLNTAARSKRRPETLLLQCIRMGVGTHQARIEQQASESKHCQIYFKFPLPCAVVRTRTLMMRMLYESGACSNRSIRHAESRFERKWIAYTPEYLLHVKPYLEQLAATPRSLKSACRLVISHHLGVSGDRVVKIKQLPLPDSLRRYLQFSDLADFNVDECARAKCLYYEWTDRRKTLFGYEWF